jgi:PIN domain nuclease of toxin-antitoxin system
MLALLDSHTLIWAQDSPAKLGAAAAIVLQDADSALLLSAGTIWEIGIKVAIGKLKLSQPYRQWIERAILDLDLIVLPISLDHAERQTILPFRHRDPFDRLLASQSLVGAIPLISCDVIFDGYGVVRIWN